MMKVARLFQDGQSQVVKLPKEFRYEGDKIFVKKMGSKELYILVQQAYMDFQTPQK